MAELGDLVSQGRKMAGEVSVDMMDYAFVDRCEKLDELRAVLHALRSHEQGHFPHLEAHTEQRILSLLPQKQQAKLKAMATMPSSAETAGAEQSLQAWQAETRNVDGLLRTQVTLSQAQAAVPPPRNTANPVLKKAPKPQRAAAAEAAADAAEAAPRLSGYDFRSWEKFDVDKECEKFDDVEREQVEAVAAARRRTDELAAKRTAVRVAELDDLRETLGVSGRSPAERDFLAKREQAKGNEAYRAGETAAAYEAYSRSAAFRPSAVVFANRAMACIKLDLMEGAEEDCSAALALDAGFTKARARRGMTRHRRGKYALAMEDLEAVVQAEPQNAAMRKLLIQSRDKLREIEGDASKSSFTRVAVIDDEDSEDDDAPAGAVRIAIADDDDSDEEDVPVNVVSSSGGAVKVSIEDDDDEEDVPVSSGGTKVSIEEDDEEEDVPINVSSGNASSSGVKVSIEEDDEEDEEDVLVNVSSGTKVLIEEDDEEDIPVSSGFKVSIEDDDDAPPALRGGFKVSIDDDDEEVPVNAPSSGFKVSIEEEEDDEPPALRSGGGTPTRPVPLPSPIECGDDGAFDVSNSGNANSGNVESESSPSSSASWEVVPGTADVCADECKSLGNAAMARGDFAAAAEHYGDALRADARHVGARSNRALARLRLGDFAGADADTSVLLKAATGVDNAVRIKALFRRAEARGTLAANESGSEKRRSLLVSAVQDLGAAVALEPANAVAKAALAAAEAAVLAHLDDHRRTKQAAVPDVPAATVPAAAVPVAAPAVPAAPAVAETAAADAAVQSEAAKARGTAAMTAGRLAEAEAEYTRAIDLGGNVAAQNNRALCRLKLEDFAGARDDAAAVLRLEPSNAKALYRRGLASRKLSHLGAAVDDFDALLKLEPKNSAAATERAAAMSDMSKGRTKTRTVVSLKEDAPPPQMQTKPPAAPPPPSPPPPPDAADEAAVVAREAKRRAATAARDSTAARQLAAARNAAKVPTAAPKTSYELERVWRELRGHEELRQQYLSLFDKSTMRKLASPAQELFDDVVKCLCTLDDKARAADVLRGASKAKSFAVSKAMLGKPELDALRSFCVGLDDATAMQLTEAFSL